MNLILLFPEDLCGDGKRARLSGRRAEHVIGIHRARAGDELTVGLANGEVGRGRIERLERGLVELAIRLDQPPPAPLPATLVLALPRPLVLRRALIAATSMGVKRIVLCNASAVEKSFWQSAAVSEARITEQLVLGLEQARDTQMPEVRLARRFRPFVEDELPEMLRGRNGLLAHPAQQPSWPSGLGGEVLLAVGPERGWNDHELRLLDAAGLHRVSLGERSLRVESAVPALLGRLL